MTHHALTALVLPIALGACNHAATTHETPIKMIEVLATSEAGHKIAPMDTTSFQQGTADGVVITIHPNDIKQTLHGIGSSFTESSAYVLAHLEPERRREVMQRIYGEAGANFTLTRTHIGSCDFCVDGKYAYADEPDPSLADFTIAPDSAGFDKGEHPRIKDPNYDLLPMIQEAIDIKRAQQDQHLRIIASAWTAPPWMKDIDTWYITAAPENNWQGTGGALKPEHRATYADYLVKYLDAYKEAGVDIWALTPVNEPHGNSGFWESMHFSPESQNEFVRDYMGPALHQSAHADTQVLVYDQNRNELEKWTDVIFGDPKTAKHVHGVAIHWYASTFKVYEETLDRVHDKFPQFDIIHTEGCIDNLGNPAGGGIQDPERFQEKNWFNNDAFWWNPTATDWAYSAEWAGPAVADHPIYTPVHRYARNIIVSIDHWVSGWVDWNIVLDHTGGPNHAKNNCGAPIMIDTTTGDIYYTPIYHVLAQFSRTIRPGDKAVRTSRALNNLDDDALHACATINDDGLLSIQLLNTTKQPIPFNLQIADHHAPITIPANTVQTVRVQM